MSAEANIPKAKTPLVGVLNPKVSDKHRADAIHVLQLKQLECQLSFRLSAAVREVH